jgi:hypothetical protein
MIFDRGNLHSESFTNLPAPWPANQSMIVPSRIVSTAALYSTYNMSGSVKAKSICMQAETPSILMSAGVSDLGNKKNLTRSATSYMQIKTHFLWHWTEYILSFIGPSPPVVRCSVGMFRLWNVLNNIRVNIFATTAVYLDVVHYLIKAACVCNVFGVVQPWQRIRAGESRGGIMGPPRDFTRPVTEWYPSLRLGIWWICNDTFRDLLESDSSYLLCDRDPASTVLPRLQLPPNKDNASAAEACKVPLWSPSHVPIR